MSGWDESLGVFLTICAPLLYGAAAFVLIGLAAWKKPPKFCRILFGILGGGLLAWAGWYYILRTLFL